MTLLSILTYLLNNLPAIILLVTTVIGFIGALKNKKKLTDKETLQYINDLVSQAETLYKAGNGNTKAQYVKSLVLQKYPKMSQEDLDKAIDATVKVFNDFKSNGKIDGSK